LRNVLTRTQILRRIYLWTIVAARSQYTLSLYSRKDRTRSLSSSFTDGQVSYALHLAHFPVFSPNILSPGFQYSRNVAISCHKPFSSRLHALSSGPPLDRDFIMAGAGQLIHKLMVTLGFSGGYIVQWGNIGSVPALFMSATYEQYTAVHGRSSLSQSSSALRCRNRILTRPQ
jgi:hypothetical protein